MRILIIKMSAIGDVILATSLIPALKKQYPDSQLAWLAEPRVVELLENNPQLDEVIIWDRSEWNRLFKSFRWIRLIQSMLAFRKRLRNPKFDLVLDAQCLLKSSFWAWVSGAKRRVGFKSKERSQIFMTESFERDYEYEMISAESRQLVAHIGIPSEHMPMSICPTEETRKQAKAKLREEEIDGKFAVISPFTTRPQKHWFEEHWQELLPKLISKYQLKILILGGPDNVELAKRFEMIDKTNVVSLAGRTSLIEGACIIEMAEFLVGVDTGMTHLGSAMNTPTVAIWGSTRPYLKGETEKTLILYDNLECSPCHRRPTCNGAFTCMKQITAKRVLDAVSKVLIAYSPRTN